MRRGDRLQARRHDPGLRGTPLSTSAPYMRTNGAVGARNVRNHSGPIASPTSTSDVKLQLTTRRRSAPIAGRPVRDHFSATVLRMVAKDLGSTASSPPPNLVSRKEMPYQIATITPFESKDESTAADYPRHVDRCLRKSAGPRQSKLAGKLNRRALPRRRAGLLQRRRRRRPEGEPRMVLDPMATTRSMSGRPPSARDSRPAFAQIAADALEVPMDRIKAYSTAPRPM